MKNVSERIMDILKNILKKTEGEIIELDKKNQRYWDSLQMIEIVFCLEQEFGVSIDSDDMVSLMSIASIEKVLNKKQ